MNENLKWNVWRVFNRTLIKGVLVALAIFILAITANNLILARFIMIDHEEYSETKWVLIGLLTGVYPIIAYFILGIFRCIKVMYGAIYELYIHPEIRNAVEEVVFSRQSNLQDMNALKRDLNDNVLFRIVEWIEDKLKILPNWVQKITSWLLRKVSSHKDFYEYMKSIKDLSPEIVVDRIAGKIEEYLENLVDDLKPFWVKILIPLHAVFLILIYFLN